MINDNLISAYSHCSHKAFLLLNYPNEANETDFFNLEDSIKYNIQEQFYLQNPSLKVTPTDLKAFKFPSQKQHLFKPFFKNDTFDFSFIAIDSDKKNVVPYQISIFDNPTKEEKKIAIFKAITLKNLLKVKITNLIFIKGVKLKTSKIKISSFAKHYTETLNDLDGILKKELITKPSNKPHCQICQFQNYCRKQLVEKEDLSLLSGLRENEILKKYSKGIFSVHQLAFTFSPKKKIYTKRKFLPELKALAIKDKKTYIIKPPEFKQSECEIYLDIEGIPNSKSYYLIGVLIKNGKELRQVSLWSDNTENDIFKECLDLVSQFSNFTIFHYGSYEISALKSKKEYFKGTKYEVIIENVLNNCVNILDEFLQRVYTPTYSNSLKDIAAFLDFEWKEADINGFKSIFWRKSWEAKTNLTSKNKLINYNLEDTKALMSVVDWLKLLKDSSNINLTRIEDFKKQSAFKFGDTGYIVPELKEINKFAYFNYQRDKIYLKTDNKLKKSILKSKLKQKFKPNEVVKPNKPEICIECGDNKVYKNRTNNKREIIDLKFRKNSIKRHITLYENAQFRCRTCHKTFFDTYASDNPKYGWGLKIWCVYQIINYNLSLGNIAKSLNELFEIRIADNSILKFKTFLSEFYNDTVEIIKNQIISGTLLQIDETQIEIKEGKGKCYIWVFTTINSVFYLFRENREAEFLIEMLKDFKGVLISDFYAGYDSVECRQQKCLIHLMRDLNDDLVKNPFNNEYSTIVVNFAILLKNITSTINNYGLKKRHLNKHRKEIHRFFKGMLSKKYTTEIAIFYQKKFKKYQEKLFTFLDFDGIPWNNNNAEVAIKPVAIHRNTMNALHTKKGIEEYLVLLSIQQTCKYRNLSFWEFLKSQRKEL